MKIYNDKGELYKMNRVEVLEDTLQIIEKGVYTKNDKNVNLKLCADQYTEAIYLSEKEIESLFRKYDFSNIPVVGDCNIYVTNRDSYEAAIKIQEKISDKNEKVLVLNFANAVHIGGGVRRGAVAQEEDLCRKSTLLCSLESDGASRYYAYHKKNGAVSASHGMILSPNVEIIKDSQNDLLEETVVVSVLTCAAPINIMGFSKIVTLGSYEKLLYERIKYILFIAAYYGYKNIVLGAWGCGAFKNDAELIAKLFKKALDKPRTEETCLKDYFKEIEFAVLCKPTDTYNYDCFDKCFNQ